MRIIRTVCGLAILAFAALPAFAQQPGTAVEAKAMLEKVVTDMKANKAKTLQDITAGTYNDKDLYPFCGGPDGKLTAHGAKKSLVGESLKDSERPDRKGLRRGILQGSPAGKVCQSSLHVSETRWNDARAEGVLISPRSTTRSAASATTNSGIS